MRLDQIVALSYVKFIQLLRLAIINLFSKILFKKQGAYNKILINRDGAFGDSIVALPALSIVRQNYPEAQIDLLSINNGNVSFNELGLNKDLINNFYTINKQKRAETFKVLKKTNYDLFIQIPQNIGIYKCLRNMFLARLYLNIKSAFGWDSGRIKSFMRLQKNHMLIPTETERFIKTLENNGLSGNTNYPIIGKRPHDQNINHLLVSPKPVVFLIGGKLQPKKWPLKHWVSLANLIGNQHDILIVGGDNEIKEAETIVLKTTNTTSVCGKLTIPELFYVLKKSALAISLDTGAMHLCDAAGIKIIALISSRDLSNKWWPNSKESVVIEKVLPCSFCLKTVCADNICMKNIEPEEVYAAFSEVYIN